MAILEKRTSRNKPSKAIPVSRDPLSSVIGGVGNTPKISGSGAQSTVRPTLTTRTSGVPKQTLTSTKRPSSSATDKVMNALTGAALGVGANKLIDRITSKPTISKTLEEARKILNDSKAKPTTSVVKPPVINPSTGLPTGTGLGDENDEYTTDSLGNTYKRMPDGTSVLYRAAEVPDEYMEDSLGNIYRTRPDGTYELYREAGGSQGDDSATSDSAETGDTVVSDSDYEQTYDDYPMVADSPQYTNDYYSDDDYYEAKRGGLIAMMKNGGNVRGYYDGGVIEDNEDGSYVISYPDGSTETYDSKGEFYESTSPREPQKFTRAYEWPEGYVSNKDGTATRVFDDGRTITVDSNMTPVRSTGATDTMYTSGTPTVTPTSTGAKPLPAGVTPPPEGGLAQTGSTSAIDSILGMLPAAGAGAFIASLLSSDSGSGSENQGLDMSKVGVINPRTTDFGIGPTKFVGYEDYGTSGGNYTPNEELLRNLNAPGFNPVNEGDYGDEDTPAPTQMASGGLSSMATPVASYYTFGQPADILANLGMRPQPPMNPPETTPQIGQQQPPQQAQQQGLPQQMPPQMAQQTPQGMPQQGIMPQQQGMPPAMRKGGLPHVSNVPFVEGRMDFRQGSAVHGEGDGQSDDIPAMLADGEYVIDAETVAQIGNGSTKAGAQALDKFREGIRSHKRSAPVNKIPPKTKALTSYLKGVK